MTATSTLESKAHRAGFSHKIGEPRYGLPAWCQVVGPWGRLPQGGRPCVLLRENGMTEQERQALDELLQWLTETLPERREPDRIRGYELLRRWHEAREAQS